jgi:hypothetical protein
LFISAFLGLTSSGHLLQGDFQISLCFPEAWFDTERFSVHKVFLGVFILVTPELRFQQYHPPGRDVYYPGI